MTASATASPTCWRTSRRASTAYGPSPRTTASGSTSSHHRNVVGDYRTPTTTRPRSTRSTAPARSCSATSARRRCWPSAATMVLHHQLSIGALVAFFLYLNRFFAPIQLLVQQYNTFQQGQASVLEAAHAAGDGPGTPQAPDAVELPPVEGEIVFDHVTFGYDPAVPVDPRRRPAHPRGRDGRVRRPDRCRQVDARQADHPLLRPDGRARS